MSAEPEGCSRGSWSLCRPATVLSPSPQPLRRSLLPLSQHARLGIIQPLLNYLPQPGIQSFIGPACLETAILLLTFGRQRCCEMLIFWDAAPGRVNLLFSVFLQSPKNTDALLLLPQITSPQKCLNP